MVVVGVEVEVVVGVVVGVEVEVVVVTKNSRATEAVAREGRGLRILAMRI